MDLNIRCSVIAAIILAFLPTAGVCGEWAIAKNGWAISEQEGARMGIACDTEHGRALHPDSLGKILIFYTEPRADWVKFEKSDVRTAADDGSRSVGGKSEGTVLSPDSLVIEDDATWELSVMGKAKNSFTITAGKYSRTFSAVKLKETVATVLSKCGDHW
jgi:hypothetical protein